MKATRRDFMVAAAAAAAAGMVSRTARAARETPPICVFSKHMQFLDYKQLAKTCKEIGLDGVDLTVRKGGHVLPENVARDLPKAIGALHDAGLATPMITTNLDDGDDPTARPILEAASKLGVRYFRIGGTKKYDLKRPPLEILDELIAGLKRLGEVAADYGMIGGYHNHSGRGYIGGPIWDLYYAIHEVNSPYIGSNFDVGHVTAEGRAGAWEVNTQLMAPVVKMMAVKDFVNAEDGKAAWVPYGDGIVDNKKIFSYVREAGFAGPISIHVEYDVDSDAQMIEEVRKTVPRIREDLKAAGYA